MKKKLIIVLVIMIVYLLIGFIISSQFKINYYEIDKLNDTKIVHISDFHIDTIKEKELDDIVEKINDEEPDVVIFTGDLFDVTDIESNGEIESYTIKGLLNINSVVKLAVLGNHDVSMEKVSSIYEKSGFKLLINEVYTFKDIDFVGLNSISNYPLDSYKDDFNNVLNKSVNEKIVIVHEPDVFDVVKDYDDVIMQLSGHSHGGQVRIPLIGGLLFPFGSKEYGNKRHYVYNDINLYVNFGFGNSILNIRHYNSRNIYVFK